MSSARLLAKIEEAIRHATNAVVSNIGEADDTVAGAVIGRSTISDLVINGSFLYRDKILVKTDQSEKRLLARLTATGKRVRPETITVIEDEAIKGHYKILSMPDAARLTALDKSVAQELANSGESAFHTLGNHKGHAASDVGRGRQERTGTSPSPLIDWCEYSAIGRPDVLVSPNPAHSGAPAIYCRRS